MNDYYNFKSEDAHLFANYIGAKTKTVGYELVFKICPYCRSEKDKNVFSINLKTGQFQCKRASCGAKGNMISLSKEFGFSLGNDVDHHYNINDINNKFISYPKMPVVKPKDEAVQFLNSRGISAEIAEKYHITLKNNTNNILVFPFTDEEKNLICIKYRKIDFVKGKDKNKEWTEKNNKLVLFGMEQCDPLVSSTLVITEGQLDSLSLAEAGIPNAVSVPNGANGFTWIPHCWDFVHKFSEIVVFGDYEKGKVTLAETITNRFQKMKIRVVRPQEYHDLKDANDILRAEGLGKKALIEAVEKAQVVRADKIISMKLVEAVDITKLECFKTGFPALDKTLGNGIPFGSLTILTGKRGDGKSTFASMIYAEMLNQGYKGFLYSGELPNYMVKAWLDTQLTGMKSISNATINKVGTWYENSSYMYDNSMTDDELCDVEEIVSEAILKYECRVIIIDNLMTAMSGGSYESVYHRQGEFMRHMARIAKKYNVAVILIAHPRKSGTVSDIDMIAGSSDIANAADIIMTYERIDKAPDNLRAVEVTKNRYNSGKTMTGDKAMRVKYSPDSMRIVPEEAPDFVKNYKWCEIGDGFSEVDAAEYLPFE